MGVRTIPLSNDDDRVQVIEEYRNNVTQMDMTKELLEGDDAGMMETKTGLTEVIVNIEGKNFKTLIDTGSVKLSLIHIS